MLSRLLLRPGFCGRTSRLLSRRRLRGCCRTFVVRGWAIRHRRRLLARHAKIIGLPLKITDEIVGDVDLGDRFAATLPECFDGFLGGVHLAIRLPVEAAQPLELGLG